MESRCDEKLFQHYSIIYEPGGGGGGALAIPTGCLGWKFCCWACCAGCTPGGGTPPCPNCCGGTPGGSCWPLPPCWGWNCWGCPWNCWGGGPPWWPWNKVSILKVRNK